MGSLLKDSVVSFFKVMIDHDFLSVLYLPPKFARTTPNLLNKKTYLENLNGRRWNVVVSKENGSLAFRKGWSDFSISHNLGIGDVVLFHYFLGQYFLVQVFNRSACDLRGSALGNGYLSKRSRSETLSVDTDGSLQATNENSGSKQVSPGKEVSNDSVILASERGHDYIHENKNAAEVHPLAIVPVENIIKGKAEPTNFEDPEVQFLMIGRDILNEQRVDRTVIDLSNYEMPRADVKSNRQLTTNVLPLPIGNTVVKCKVEPDVMEFTNPKQEMTCHAGFSESTKRKEVERSLYSGVKKEKYDAPIARSPNSTATSTKYESDVKNKKDDAPTIGYPSSTTSSPKYESDVNKKISDALTIRSPSSTAFSPKYKSDVPELTVPKSVFRIKKEVKSEPFEETGLPLETASASDLHCPIRSASSMFLELPGSLPLFTTRLGASDMRCVILRDSAERLWDVFYHHKPSMKLLTTGWPAFLKANKIHSGDECIFKADTKVNGTYDVSIVRKKDRPT